MSDENNGRRDSRASRRAERQGEAAENALKEILLAIFYRHECAKRNEDIVGESEELLKGFPKTKAARDRNSRFYNPSKQPIVDLTDFLLMDINEKPGRLAKKRTDALGAFLTKRRVFPVPSPDKEFMPFPGKNDEKENQHITKPALEEKYWLDCWGRIQAFETYAIAKLGLKRPIFSPFVTFPENRKLYPQTIANIQSVQDNTYGAVLIDWNQANKTISYYFSAWISLQREIAARRKIGVKPPVAQDTSPVIKGKNHGNNDTLKRIKWDKLEPFLAALDYDRAHKEDIKKMARASAFNQDYLNEPEAATREALNTQYENYKHWVKRGEYYSKNYFLIV